MNRLRTSLWLLAAVLGAAPCSRAEASQAAASTAMPASAVSGAALPSTGGKQDAPAALAIYVGQYHSAADATAVTAIYLEAGRLYEESADRAREVLVPDPAAGADSLKLSDSPTHAVFARDAAGQITAVKFTLDANQHVLTEQVRFSLTPTRLRHDREYLRQEAMIPMRDGVKLHAVILRPANAEAGEPLPFLMDRTPYGVDEYTGKRLNQSLPELAASGYLFVYEDVRGRYGSGGTFVMNRPIVPHTGKADIDETTDVSDTVDWLLKNVPGNNGRVGVFGVSYDGFLAMMAGIDPNPAVKAISPQAPMTDVWMGDDFFHNGAFRQTYGFDYVQQMEGQKTDAVVDAKEDTYDFFLRHGNFAGAAEAAHMTDLPTAKVFLSQPEYTSFWRDMAVQDRLTQVSVPTLEVGGYWDQEDMWGTQAEYAALKPHDTKHEVFLVLGPWNHGQWEGAARQLGSKFGKIDFGEPTGTEFRKQFETPFFERYLKDRPGFDLADTASFRTGVNRWERYSAWPPVAGFQSRNLYLKAFGQLDDTAPASAAGDGAVASYIADPADPIPYRHRPIQSTYAPRSSWYTWLVEDQRFVSGRKDLVNFTTLPLEQETTVTGEVMADLFAATTGSDADWVVKLIDEAPGDDGYQLMVAEEIFRGRYLKNFEHPEALVPGAVYEFRWSLHGVDHTFAKGHRMMVEVQSSWFPLYDRNPQTYVPNIMRAAKDAYKSETVTIYSSPQRPSHLEFQVAK